MKKKIIIIIVSIVLVILVALGITYYIFTNKDKQNISDIKSQLQAKVQIEDQELEYNTTINIKELLNNEENVVIKIDDEEITTDEYTFKELKDYKVEKYTFSTYKTILNKEIKLEESNQSIYKIVDTTKPEIVGVEDKTITQGDTIDIKEGISVTDNVDETIEPTFEGEVDTNTVGEYTIKVKAIDSSNNEEIKEFKVTVNEKPKVTTSNTKKTTTSTSKNNSNNSHNTDTTQSQTTTSNNSNSSNSVSLDFNKYDWSKEENWGYFKEGGGTTRDKNEAKGGYFYGGELDEEDSKALMQIIQGNN